MNYFSFLQDDSDSEGEEVPIQFDADYLQIGPWMLDSNSDPRELASYLFDEKYLKFSNNSEILVAFGNLQEVFAKHVYELDQDSRRYDSIVGQLYFKFRHDVFAQIIKNLLGVSDVLGTDVDLRPQGIDLTPDYIYETENVNYLLEFTVSSDLSRVDYQKGGGMVGHKYEEAASVLEVRTGKKYTVLTIPCILSKGGDGVMNKALSILGISNNSILEFKKICMKHWNVIGPYLATCYTGNYNPNFPIDESTKTEFGSKKCDQKFITVTDDILLKITQAKDQLKRFLNRKIRSTNLGHFSMDLKDGRLKFDINPPEDFSIQQAYDTVVNFNISKMISIIRFKSEGNKCHVSKLGGTQLVPVESVSIEKIAPECLRVPPNQIYQEKIPRLEKMCRDEKHCNIYPEESEMYWAKHEHSNIWPERLISKKKEHNYLFDNSYYNQLVEYDYGNYQKSDLGVNNLLVNNPVDENSLSDAADHLSKELLSINSQGHYRKKQSFLLPLVTGELIYGDIDKPNYSMLDGQLSSNPFLKEVLRKAKLNMFVSKHDDREIIEHKNKTSRLESKMFLLLRKNFPERIPKRNIVDKQMSDDAEYASLKNDLKNEHRKWQSEIAKKSKSLTVSRTVAVSKNNQHVSKSSFSEEMTHFTKNKSICGVGQAIVHEYEEVNQMHSILFEHLKKDAQEPCKTSLFNNETGPGPDYLTKLKKEYLKSPSILSDEYRRSYLGKSAEFVSRFCYSLFKLSTNSTNCKNVTIDNLGYDNVLMFVRGGPKCYQTGNCRLFRLCYPIKSELELILGYNEDYKIFRSNSVDYVLTPWTQFSINIIKTGMNLYHSIFQMLSIYCIREEIRFVDIPNFELLSALLAFHQKRQTEVTLHNSRYLIVNSSGNYSNLKGIISSFASYNYTYFDAWIKESIRLNIHDFFKTSHKLGKLNEIRLENALNRVDLRHFITNELIKSSNSLTSMIYCTYAMTTGQYNKAIEQSRNLEGILEDVVAAKKHNLGSMKTDVERDVFEGKLYDNDFCYDPKFCQYLGYVMGSCISSRIGTTNISNYWENCINRSLGSIITPSGLRGYNKGNFFNRKSYMVTYEFILDHFSDIMRLSLNEFKHNDVKGRIKAAKKDKITIADTCVKWQLVEAVFHAVDKQQRAGGREIYVMDILTKIFQQPVESFIGKLCTHVDNEYISIPSDKRGQKIHNLYYDESRESWEESWNLVLDCRRWAPRSVVQKYMHFIHGMSSFLPGSFVNHFMFLFEKMLRKRIITRDYVYETFKNNRKKSWMTEMLFKGEEKFEGSYSFEMNASFIMGMFNYLSSLMHAANQLIITNVIRDKHLNNHGKLTIIKPVAHSDDSTAKILTQTVGLLPECLTIYDVLLKAANHMISVKKSVVSRVYQEFLSVLYFFGENLPVLKKFCSSINFSPSDKGYSVDATYAVSKSIEAQKNGATFQEAYLIMKVTESAIRYLYRMPPPRADLFFGVMGMIDPHPIEVMISGTGGEFYKHCLYNRKKTSDALHFMHRWLKDPERNYIEPTVKWDMGFFVPIGPKQFMKDKIGYKNLKFPEDVQNSWTIKNGKFDTTCSSIMSFIKMLDDKSFYRSIVSDPSEKPLSRVMGAYRSRDLLSDYTVAPDNKPIRLTPCAFLETLTNYLDGSFQDLTLKGFKFEDDLVEPYLNVLDPIYSELKSTYDSFGNLLNEIMTQNQTVTLKPVQAHMLNNNIGVPSDFPISKLVTYMKEPEYYWLYGDERDPDRQCKIIKDYLKIIGVDESQVDADDLSKIFRRVLGEENKLLRFQAYVASEKRFLRGPQDLLELIASNSLYRKRLVITNKEYSSFGNDYFDRTHLIPKKVREFAQMHWAYEYIKKKGLDVFVLDGTVEKIESARLTLDNNWRVMVESTNRSKNLNDLNYWFYWSVKQIKIGDLWSGEGEAFFRLPEMDMQVKVENSHVIEIKIDNICTNFSKTSDWFLTHVVERQICLLRQMLDIESYSILENFISFNEHSGWNVNSSQKKSSIYPVKIDSNIGPTWKNESYELIRKGGKVFFYKDGIKHEIQTVIDQPMASVTKVKQMLNIPLIKEAIRVDMTMKSKLIDFQVRLTGRVKIELDTFIYNVQSSLVYNIIYNYHQSEERVENSPNNFIRSLIEYKSSNKNFGFPDLDELIKSVNDPTALRLPELIVRTVMAYPKFELSFEMKKTIMRELESAVRYGDDHRIRSFFSAHSGQILMTMAMRSNLPCEIAMSSMLSSRNIHFDWLVSLLKMISDFVSETNPTFLFGDKSAKIEFKKLTTILLMEMAKCRCLPSTLTTQRWYTMIERLCEFGMLKYFNTCNQDFWCMQDFTLISVDEFLRVVGCILHNSAMSMQNFLRPKQNQVEDKYTTLWGRFKSFPVQHGALKVKTMSHMNRINIRSLDPEDFDDAIGSYRPHFRVTEDDNEDFADEVNMDGDYDEFELIPIEETEPILFNVDYLSEKKFLIAAGSSKVVLYQCIAADRSICRHGYNMSYYRLKDPDNLQSRMIIAIHPKRIKMEIEGFIGSKYFPNYTTFPVLFGLTNEKQVGVEIYKVENRRMRDQLEKQAQSLLRKMAPQDLKSKDRLLDNLQEIGQTEYTDQLVARIKNKIRSLENQGLTFEDLINKLMNRDWNDIKEDMANLVEEIESKQAFSLPQILNNLKTTSKAEALSDPTLLGELDVIYPGLADIILRGELHMSEEEVLMSKKNVAMMVQNNSGSKFQPQSLAISLILNYILDSAVISNKSNYRAVVAIQLFISKLTTVSLKEPIYPTPIINDLEVDWTFLD